MKIYFERLFFKKGVRKMRLINLGIKRVIDILASGIAIVMLLPLEIGIAIAIKMDSKGPILFRQERRSLNGKIFRMLKFRTMVVDAEKQGTGLFNFKNDPRVTRIGRKLRDSSLDELPQLLNVFWGDMSLVGPRPCVSYELGDFDTLNDKYKKRFRVKAGMTGLAQISGRNDISWDQKVEYDNQYVELFEKMGILVDIRILFISFFKVFKKTDIYEVKTDDSISDLEAAKLAEEEVIRLAHLPDKASGECK